MAAADGDLTMQADRGSLARLLKLERVRDQILKELPHLQGVRVDHGQIADIDSGALLFNGDFEIAKHIVDNLRQPAWLERLRAAGNARELEQILNEHLHAFRGALHASEIIPTLFAQRLTATGAQPVTKSHDLAQRLLKIVRGHGGEAL